MSALLNDATGRVMGKRCLATALHNTDRMSDSPANKPLFDSYAKEYDAALMRGVSVSGEGKEYFARGRAHWLTCRLAQMRETPQTILDFGCGTGSATPFLLEIPGINSLIGVDVSSDSIQTAKSEHGSDRARFFSLTEFKPSGTIHLAFCNGVFHHIPLAERDAAVRLILQSVRPGSLFAFWENNPWNPGTRIVMSRIPFDRDAITLTPPEARELLKKNGFEILRTDFQFIFPKFLSRLRPLEKALAPLPFGAQYLVLCRKPR
jgi:SAM-dependent methyltransferase